MNAVGSGGPTSEASGAARTRRVRQAELSWQLVDDHVVILDLRRSQYIDLNPSAAALFVLLADGAPRGDLVRALCEAYGLSTDQAESDVTAFLASCERQGLLEDA